MTDEQVAALKPGIYRVRFKDGRVDIAAIGCLKKKGRRDRRWMAPISARPVMYPNWARVDELERVGYAIEAWPDPTARCKNGLTAPTVSNRKGE